MKLPLAILIFFMAAINADAAVWVVPVDVQTIQAAIDSSADGDTVLVLPGEYAENLNFNGTDVALLAVGGPRVTTIRAADEGAVVTIVGGESPRTVLFGFTLTGGVAGRDGYGGGIVIERSSPTIIGNIITGNRAEQGGGGISASFAPAAPIITRNLIVDNQTDNGGGGLSFYQCSGILINNTIVDNAAGTDGGGVNLPFTVGLTAVNNIIANNQSGRNGAVAGWMAQASRFSYNDVWGNTGGNYSDPIRPGEGSISQDPAFVDPDNGNYHLRDNSPCIDSGDPDLPADVDGSRSDMGCYPFVTIPTSPLDLDPPELEWDVIDVGDSLALDFSLMNNQEADAQAVALIAQVGPFRIEPSRFEVEAGGEAAGQVWFAPRAAGQFEDSLSLVVFIATPIGDTLNLWLPYGREVIHLRGEARAVSVGESNPLPNSVEPLACYPNPFNIAVTVAIDRQIGAMPIVSVWTLAGRQVAVLNLAGTEPDRWFFRWNAAGAAPGAYWVRMERESYIGGQRIILLK